MLNFYPEKNYVLNRMFWDGIFIDYFNLASKSIEEVAKLGKGFWKLPSKETKLPIPIPSRKKVKYPEIEFFDINLTKGSSLLLHAIHSPFNLWILKKKENHTVRSA
jgi:hypothetical protein